MSARGQPGVPPSSTDTSGRAMAAIIRLTGTSSSTAQLSSAAEVRRTCSGSDRTGPASTGTTTAVSAPPATMS